MARGLAVLVGCAAVLWVLDQGLPHRLGLPEPVLSALGVVWFFVLTGGIPTGLSIILAGSIEMSRQARRR